MTVLTLPNAGTSPGRAARAVPLTGDNSGELISQLGDVMLDAGLKLEAEKLDRSFRRNQVDMTRDLNDLRLQVEAIGDPDQSSAAWDEGLADLRRSYMAPGEDGALRVHPKNAEQFTLAFDDLANRHAYKVGARNLSLRQSERAATYDRYVFEATRAGATADVQTRQTMIEAGEEQIAALQLSGVWDAEQAEAARQDLRTGMASGAALEAMNGDPERFLQRLDAGEFDDLEPTARARYRVAATDALAKDALAAQKLAEKAAKDHRDAVNSDLSRIASLGDTTRLDPRDRAFVDSKDVRDLAKVDPEVDLARRKVLARMSLDEDKDLYSALSPVELRRVIADERARPVRHKFQEERLQVLEEHLDRVEGAVNADPIGHVRDVLGIKVPDLVIGDDIADFERGVAARKQLSGWMMDRGFIKGDVLFQPEERKQIKAALAADQDPAARQTLIAGLTRQLGPAAMTVLEAATGDKATAHTASLVAFGAAPDVVADILTGQKRMADGTANRPSDAALSEVFDSVTDGMFGDQHELQARIMRAAEAIYAEENPHADSGKVDSDELRKAVNRALGGDGAIGGLVDVNPRGARNEYKVPVPPGVSEQALDMTMGALAIGLRRRPVRNDAGEVTGINAADLSPFVAASINGAAPDFGDGSAAALFEDLRILPIWADGKPADRYVFVRETAAGPIALKSADGDRYEFSLRRLVREAGQ